jgi:hypothetical protein
VNNLKVNAVQRQNDDLTLKGTVDVSKQGTGTGTASAGLKIRSWKDVPATVSITSQNTIVTLSIDKNSPVSQLFNKFPIIGIVTSGSS